MRQILHDALSVCGVLNGLEFLLVVMVSEPFFHLICFNPMVSITFGIVCELSICIH